MVSKIQIVSENGSGLESRLTVNAEIYDVETEDLGADRHKIVTRLYHQQIFWKSQTPASKVEAGRPCRVRIES